MIAFAAFVFETDDAATVLSVKQSILEQVRATRNRLRHFPDNDLAIAPSGKTVFERSIRTAAIMLSFTLSVRLVVNDGKVGERALWYIVPIYTKLIHILSKLYYVSGIIYYRMSWRG